MSGLQEKATGDFFKAIHNKSYAQRAAKAFVEPSLTLQTNFCNIPGVKEGLIHVESFYSKVGRSCESGKRGAVAVIVPFAFGQTGQHVETTQKVMVNTIGSVIEGANALVSRPFAIEGAQYGRAA